MEQQDQPAQSVVRGRAADIESLLQDLETHGITIVGRNALSGRLNAAKNWRQDFIFWARAGATIGLAHVYEGPKAERRERETQIRETMLAHEFSKWSAEMYLRMISNPTIMAQAYAQGVVNLEQMQTVEKKSILRRLGDWLTGRNKLVDGHAARVADIRLVRRMIERDPDSPEARAYLGGPSGYQGRSEAQGTAMLAGVSYAALALGSLEEHMDNIGNDPAAAFVEKMHQDDLDRDIDACMAFADQSRHDFDSTPSYLDSDNYGSDFGSSSFSSDSFGSDFGSDSWSSTSSFDDFGSSSFSSDSFGSDFGSGSGSGFGPDF